MAKKKKPESMLTRQRRLLREQRAKKAAAKKAQEKAAKAPKKLPGKGKTTANKPKAKLQRGLRRDRMARQQLENFGRAFKKTLKQGAAQDKLKKAAKGTKSNTVRTAQGKPELVKRSSSAVTKPKGGPLAKKGGLVKSPGSTATDGRIQRVKVKVDPPKQLKGKPQPKALPPAKKALPGAKTPKALKGAVKKAGGLKNLIAQGIALELAGSLAETIGQPGQSRMSKLGIQGPTKKKTQNKPTTPAKKTNRRGRAVTKPAKRGMSNIPPKEGTGKGSPNDTKRVAPLKPAGKVSSTSKPSTKKLSLKEAAYAKDARNKEYDRLRKAGKTKEAEALGKKIAADARKKPSDSPNSSKANPFRAPQGKERKDRFSRDVAELRSMRKKQKKTKTPQSRALRVGWKGNRNY